MRDPESERYHILQDGSDEDFELDYDFVRPGLTPAYDTSGKPLTISIGNFPYQVFEDNLGFFIVIGNEFIRIDPETLQPVFADITEDLTRNPDGFLEPY